MILTYLPNLTNWVTFRAHGKAYASLQTIGRQGYDPGRQGADNPVSPYRWGGIGI